VTLFTVVVFRPLMFRETPTTSTRFVPVVVCEKVSVFAAWVRSPEADVTLSSVTCACAIPMHNKMKAGAMRNNRFRDMETLCAEFHRNACWGADRPNEIVPTNSPS